LGQLLTCDLSAGATVTACIEATNATGCEIIGVGWNDWQYVAFCISGEYLRGDEKDNK
jgi:hypothetical protein